jgi:hypothetical protein
MLFSHGIFAGPIDGIISALAVSYVVKFAPQLMVREQLVNQLSGSWLTRNKMVLLVFIAAVVLCPLGLLASGTAYGEWGIDEVKQLLGYVPSGMAHYADKWHAVMPDYSLPKLGESIFSQSMGYMISAIVGIIVISSLIILSSKIVKRSVDKM